MKIKFGNEGPNVTWEWNAKPKFTKQTCLKSLHNIKFYKILNNFNSFPFERGTLCVRFFMKMKNLTCMVQGEFLCWVRNFTKRVGTNVGWFSFFVRTIGVLIFTYHLKNWTIYLKFPQEKLARLLNLWKN